VVFEQLSRAICFDSALQAAALYFLANSTVLSGVDSFLSPIWCGGGDVGSDNVSSMMLLVPHTV
jgi:hypothetical protein